MQLLPDISDAQTQCTQRHIKFTEFSCFVHHMLVDVIVSGWTLNYTLHINVDCVWGLSRCVLWTSLNISGGVQLDLESAVSFKCLDMIQSSTLCCNPSGNKSEHVSVIQPGKMNSSYNSDRTVRKTDWRWGVQAWQKTVKRIERPLFYLSKVPQRISLPSYMIEQQKYNFLQLLIDRRQTLM